MRAVGEISADPSTVSRAHFTMVGGSSAPSRATMAPPPRSRQHGASMSAIVRARRTYVHTQHWPEHEARTNAPCHTHLAAPPGLATRRHRKPAPVGTHAEHDDENGHANRDYGAACRADVMRVTGATWVVDVSAHVTTCGDQGCARALTDVPSPGPRSPALLPHASRPPVLLILRPVAATSLRVLFPSSIPPSLQCPGVVVCVNA